MKNIKNYTTELPVERHIEKIKKILVAHDAKKILEDYDNGKIVRISFIIDVEGKQLPFVIPARIDNVLIVLYGKPNYKGYTLVQQDRAARVAWANIRDWIDSQMAFIDIGQAKIQEVFLPYMITGEGRTLYSDLNQSQFMLPSRDD